MADSSAIKTMVLNAVGEAMSTVRQEVIEAVKEIADGDLNTRIKKALKRRAWSPKLLNRP